MKRLVCAVRGHAHRAVVLPEEVFGLYRYSSIDCSRCGARVEEGVSKDDQIQTLFEYVTLWNDVRPIVNVATRMADVHRVAPLHTGKPHRADLDDLVELVEKYRALYPEHDAVAWR